MNDLGGSPYSGTAYYVATAELPNSTPTVKQLKDVFLYPTVVKRTPQLTLRPGMKSDRVEVYNVLGENVKTFSLSG